jgi:hypothetical protein
VSKPDRQTCQIFFDNSLCHTFVIARAVIFRAPVLAGPGKQSPGIFSMIATPSFDIAQDGSQ